MGRKLLSTTVSGLMNIVFLALGYGAYTVLKRIRARGWVSSEGRRQSRINLAKLWLQLFLCLACVVGLVLLIAVAVDLRAPVLPRG